MASSSSSFSGFSPSAPVPLCHLLSSLCTGVVMTVSSSSVCSMTSSAATPVVSTALIVLPLVVMPVEPVHKWRREDLLEDRQEMLATFEVAFIPTSVGPSRLFVSTFGCCSTRVVFCCPGPGPSVPAAGARPSTPPGSLPSSRSAASSKSLPHGQSWSCWPLLVIHAAPAWSPSALALSHH